MKQSLSVLVMLRYSTSNSLDLIAGLERGLDCAEVSGDFAVHWCYPIHSLLGDSSSRADRVVARLKARPNDRMLPAGFTGAYHSILQDDELRKELQWTLRNPWHEDLKTAFGSQTVAALFPPSLDLVRAKSCTIYATGPRLLAIDDPNRALVVIEGEGLASIPLLSPSRYDSRRLTKELLRHYRHDAQDCAAIILDGLGVPNEELTTILATVAELREKRSGFSIGAIDALPVSPASRASEFASLTHRVAAVPNDPLSRAHRHLGPQKSRGRKRGADELIRRRLERLCIVDPGGAQRELDRTDEPSVDDRTLIADMSGTVTLAESQMRVRFDAGRLAGMAHGQTQIVVEQPSRSYLRYGGRSREFTTVSTFSFEGDRCRGLRTVKTFEGDGVGQPGQLIEDYYFEDGQGDLLATITVAYPEVRGADYVEEYSPLELSLFSTRPDEDVEAEGEYPGGERYTVRLRPQQSPFQLCGQQITFRSRVGEFRLRFPELQNAVPEVVAARFRKSSGGYTLCISPRGSYAPAPSAAFTGIVEQFRVAVSVAAGQTQEGLPPVENAAPERGRK